MLICLVCCLHVGTGEVCFWGSVLLLLSTPLISSVMGPSACQPKTQFLGSRHATLSSSNSRVSASCHTAKARPVAGLFAKHCARSRLGAFAANLSLRTKQRARYAYWTAAGRTQHQTQCLRSLYCHVTSRQLLCV